MVWEYLNQNPKLHTEKQKRSTREKRMCFPLEKSVKKFLYDYNRRQKCFSSCSYYSASITQLYFSLKITPHWRGTASGLSTAAALLPLWQMFPARFVSCKVSLDFWGQKHFHGIFLALWLLAKTEVYKTALHLQHIKPVLKIHCCSQ